MAEVRLPIIAINNTVSDIEISDLGITLPADSTTTLSILFTRFKLVESDDLKTEVQNGDVIINDGSQDLSIEEAIDHLTFQTEYEDRSTLGPGYHIGDSPPDDPESVDGWFNTEDKIFYIYDRKRSKWLSIDRANLVFQKINDVNNEYLKIGQLVGSNIGYLMPRKGTVVSVSAKSSSGFDNKRFQVRDDTTPLLNFQYENDQKIDSTANVDFNAEALLQCFARNDTEVPANWYDGDWLYRKKITINGNQVAGQITYGNASSSSGGSGTTLSFSHTISGQSNRILIVCAGTENTSPGPTVSGVTYNGQAMTQVSQTVSDNGSFQNRLAMFYMLEDDLPSAGSYTVTITYSGSTANRLGGAVSFYGVKQQAPKNTQTDNNTGSNTIDVNVTTDVNNSVVIDTAVCGNAQAFTPGAGQTERFDVAAPSSQLAGSTKSVATAGSTTMTQTVGSGNRLAQIATVLEPAGELTDFPVLMSFTNSDLNKAKSDGSDLVFTDSTNGVLDFEIEKFTQSTGALVAWVRIPALSTGTNVETFLYYGNDSASSLENASGVWDDDYVGVWHLSDSFEDSTDNNNDGSNTGTTDVAGKIGDARDFEYDSSQYISVPDSASLRLDDVDLITIEAWINKESTQALAWQAIVQKSDASYNLQLENADTPFFTIYDGSYNSAEANAPIANGQWYHLVGTFDGSTVRLYINGVLQSTTAAASSISSNTGIDVGIGENLDNTGRYFDGIIDEVRISKIARSAVWIQTSFNNQNTPSTFLTLGSEEGQNVLSTTQPIVTIEVAWRP
jgi:hypothetical protein